MDNRAHFADRKVDEVEPLPTNRDRMPRRSRWRDWSRRLLVGSIALLIAATGIGLVTKAFLPSGVESTENPPVIAAAAVSNGEIWARVGGGDGASYVYRVSLEGPGETALFNDGREPGGPGTVHPTAVGEHYDWSPDGSQVAFSDWVRTTGTHYEIFLMRPNGTEITQLTHDVGLASFPSWSPDGARIAYASARQGPFMAAGCEGTDLCPSDIYVVGTDGFHQMALTTHPADDSSPDWSPDGSRIVFVSGRDERFGDIFVMNADGSGVTQLTSGPASDGQPAWSPDGSTIAFVRFGFKIPLDVWVMDADGTDLRRLTDTGSDTNIYYAWSPDGTKIAFTSPRDTGSFEVWVMDADGTDQRRITDLGGLGHGDLAWRPIPYPQPAGERFPDCGFNDPAGEEYRNVLSATEGSTGDVVTFSGPTRRGEDGLYAPAGRLEVWWNTEVPATEVPDPKPITAGPILLLAREDVQGMCEFRVQFRVPDVPPGSYQISVFMYDDPPTEGYGFFGTHTFEVR